jgi:hypothetical protein
VISRILIPALICLAALAAWLPREALITADDAVDPISHVEFTATAGTATAPFVERWDLAFPVGAENAQRLVLEIGPATDQTASARITAAGGDPVALRRRLVAVFGEEQPPGPALPRPSGLDVTLDLIGERLAQGEGDVGSTVIAGAFVTDPPGDWRVYRITFGTGGPQCFLAVDQPAGIALLLPRDPVDGPGIEARFRALLLPSGT